MKIRIYKGIDITTAVPVDVEVFGAKVSRVLNGKDEITFNVESETALDIPLYSTIAVDVGIYSRFYMNELPTYEKESSVIHKYSFRFQSPLSDLEKVAFVNSDGELDFYFNGKASDFIDLIILNLGNAGADIASTWEAGTSDTTEYRNIQFSNQTCWAALNTIMDAFELELKVSLFTDYAIALVNQVGESTLINVSYGSGNGLFNIKRTNIDVDKLVTRLYYRGSNQNLPPDYDYTRLRGSADYIEQNKATYRRRDGFKIFEDIKPNYTGTVASASMNDIESICSFVDSGFPFDLNTVDANGNTLYLIAGTTAKINFLTGACAGVTCDVKLNGFDWKNGVNPVIEIIPYEYENGYKIPNSTVIPAATDTFKIFDIMMPAGYVTTAVTDLNTAATEYLAKYSTPRVQYNLKTDTKYFYENDIQLDLGDQIAVSDVELSISETCRVIETSFPLFDRYEQTVKLSDVRFAIPGRAVKTFLKMVEKSVQLNNLDSVDKTSRSQKTTAELKSRTFTTKKLYSSEAAQETVKEYFIPENNTPEGLDPYMLALDSGEPQFILSSGIKAFEESIIISAGTFTHRSYNAITRAEIQKKLDASEVYNPKQSWTIAEQSMAITAGTPYYVYMKVDNSKNLDGSLAGTTATMHVSADVLNNKYTTTDYLYYLVGKVSETRELSLLWGNDNKPSNKPKGGKVDLLAGTHFITFGSAFVDQYGNDTADYFPTAIGKVANAVADTAVKCVPPYLATGFNVYLFKDCTVYWTANLFNND
jgi:hypothetical protein